MTDQNACRRCDRPTRYNGAFCSEACRESFESEGDDGDDDLRSDGGERADDVERETVHRGDVWEGPDGRRWNVVSVWTRPLLSLKDDVTSTKRISAVVLETSDNWTLVERCDGKEVRTDGGTPQDGVEHELLTALIQWSFEHPAEWDEWRKTLLVFSTLSGLSESTILQAHTEAQKRAGVTEPDEVADAFETAEELLKSAQERDVDLPEISIEDGGSR